MTKKIVEKVIEKKANKKEKPEIKNKIGDEIEPIIRLFVLFSKNKWIKEIAQLKKINDSYKLLNGKYPSPIQRNNNVRANNKLLKNTKNLLRLNKELFVGRDKLIQ